jgi:hypothetical protein
MSKGKNQKEWGVFYIAIGEQFVEEGRESALTVREVMPEVPITLLTNIDKEFEEFDNIIYVDDPNQGFEDKIRYMSRSPYKRSLYLDTDTHLTESVSELFEVLDEFDLSISFSPYRAYREVLKTDDGQLQIRDLPDCVPQYNTGVMSFVDNDKTRDLFNSWWKISQSDEAEVHANDQMSFMESLYQSNVRYITIPQEYNFRYRNPGDAVGKVKIIHGRLMGIQTPGRSLDHPVREVENKINKDYNPRVYITGPGGFKVISNSKLSILHRVKYSVEQDGVATTTKKILRKITGST